MYANTSFGVVGWVDWCMTINGGVGIPQREGTNVLVGGIGQRNVGRMWHCSVDVA